MALYIQLGCLLFTLHGLGYEDAARERERERERGWDVRRERERERDAGEKMEWRKRRGSLKSV